MSRENRIARLAIAISFVGFVFCCNFVPAMLERLLFSTIGLLDSSCKSMFVTGIVSGQPCEILIGSGRVLTIQLIILFSMFSIFKMAKTACSLSVVNNRVSRGTASDKPESNESLEDHKEPAGSTPRTSNNSFSSVQCLSVNFPFL